MFTALDLKYALRLLAMRPRFAVLTVLVLAGGLAVSLYTYNVLNTMLYKPLPIPDGASVVQIQGWKDGSPTPLSASVLAELRSNLRSLSEVGAFMPLQVRLGNAESSRAVNAVQTEWNVFEFTRTLPLMGRRFVQADHRTDSESVAVVGYDLWQSTFAADPDVVGRIVDINGTSTRVIGVMPRGYAFPANQQLWLPLGDQELSPNGYSQSMLFAYARLLPGHSAETAEAELNTRLRNVKRQRANGSDDQADAVLVGTFQAMSMGTNGPHMFAVLNVVSLFILLLACVNVGNLLLARINERINEISLRVALGAPRLRLMLQMLMEYVLICVLGVSLALALVSLALTITEDSVNSLVARLGIRPPFWWEWHLDGSTMLVAAVFTLATIFTISILPIHGAASVDPATLLRDGTRQAGRRATGLVSRSLVAVQIALVATVMLAGTGLATVAYRFTQIEFGRDPTHVFNMPVALPADSYGDPRKQLSFYEKLLQELRRDPQIEAAVVEEGLGETAFVVDGAAHYAGDDDYPRAALVMTSETPVRFGAPLVEGRDFDSRDGPDGLPTAMISETVAEAFWPDDSAVGRRIRIRNADGTEDERIIVGVLGDVRRGHPLATDWSAYAALYVPLRQAVSPMATVVIKHLGGDERAARDSMYRALGSVDAYVPPGPVMSNAAVQEQLTVFANTLLNVFVGCTIFAISLAMVGIYGLSSNSVIQRTHEIGLRRAMGASDGRIIALFFAQGSRQLALGLAASIFASAGLLILIASFGRIGGLVLTLMGAIVLSSVASLVLIAIYIAIRRAVRYEPAVALRHS